MPSLHLYSLHNQEEKNDPSPWKLWAMHTVWPYGRQHWCVTSMQTKEHHQSAKPKGEEKVKLPTFTYVAIHGSDVLVLDATENEEAASKV